MKVNVEDVTTVKKILHVEIPEQEVTRELEKAYSTLKNNIKLKGFRPGKVPLALLEKRFKKEIQDDVSGQLIQGSYAEALEKAELKPLSDPVLDRPELEKGQPYKYSATLEVRPPLGDLNVRGLELKEEVYTVDDEEVEAQLKILQKRNAQLKTVEDKRPAKTGDVVIIDYEGFKDGKPFDPARKTENFQVELGSRRILEELDKQLVGMKRDETKEVPVHFPDDYYNKDLAGLDVTFKVSLKELKEEILPALDDEFAKDLGEYETLADLKKAIRENLEGKYQAQSRRKLRQDIFDQLTAQCDFELPQGLVEEELAMMVKDAQAIMTQRRTSLEMLGQTEEGLSEKYRPLAERKVREYLVMEKVIEQEGITLTDELVDKAHEEMAETLGASVEAIKEYHKSDPKANEVFRQKTLEKYAIRYITENNAVKKVPVREGDGEAKETAEP